MSDDTLITAEQLHTAASLAAMTTSDVEAGFEKGALDAFINDSEFHPPMEALPLVYGILIGRLSVRVVESERNNGNGD